LRVIEFYSYFKEIWSLFNKKKKIDFLFILGLIVVSSVFEFIGVGAIIPFLGFIIKGRAYLDSFDELKPLSIFIDYLNLDFEICITSLFIILIVIATLIRVFLIYKYTKFTFDAGKDLSNRVYNNILHMEYSYFINKNSSEIIDGLVQKVNAVIYNVLIPVLRILSSLFLFITLLFGILYINFIISFSVIIIFLLIYTIIMKFNKSILLSNSEIVAKEGASSVKIMQESLGSIRDVIVDKKYKYYLNIFCNANNKLRNAQASNTILEGAPKFIVESIAIILMAIIISIAAKGDKSIQELLPLAGFMALAIQKMLPLSQQIYSSWAGIAGSWESFQFIHKILIKPAYINQEDIRKVDFQRNVRLKNIHFSFGQHKILKGINLEIIKGSCIALIGKTGEGKSTTIDILLGLLNPQLGDLLVDDIRLSDHEKNEWQKLITHVPQNMYLVDGSIAENIAFGINKDLIDYDRVKITSEISCIAEDIEQMEGKYNEIIGEKGFKLSGGQRQRISIARALYKNANFIILDEATSAMDSSTQKKVMDNIKKQGITILMVTHNLELLYLCEKVYQLKNGNIIDYEIT
jgi:ATP-binding cassette subfamily B protein